MQDNGVVLVMSNKTNKILFDTSNKNIPLQELESSHQTLNPGLS